MVAHRTYSWGRSAIEAAGFGSWNAAGRALVSITDRPNDAGALLADCEAAEVYEFGGRIVVTARTVRGAVYYLVRR